MGLRDMKNLLNALIPLYSNKIRQLLIEMIPHYMVFLYI